jgi:hypothetical protein
LLELVISSAAFFSSFVVNMMLVLERYKLFRIE